MLQPAPKRYSQFLDRIASLLGTLIGLLLLAMVAIMFSSVIWRYVLNAPLVWADQLSQWIFVWMTYLGVAVGYRLGVHIGVDIVVRRLPRFPRFAVATLVDLVIGIFLLVVIYQGYGITVRSLGQVYGALELPPSCMYAAAPVSCGLMLLFMLDAFKSRVRNFMNRADAQGAEAC
jgi:TRAP-type C4-dicarboxylate transport system permease small subunit